MNFYLNFIYFALFKLIFLNLFNIILCYIIRLYVLLLALSYAIKLKCYIQGEHFLFQRSITRRRTHDSHVNSRK